MVTWPIELLSHTFKYACSDDFGETARRLGLVSKHFRAIAEPIELRTIKISGIEQLQWYFVRLEKLYGSTTEPGSNKTPFYVEHLFISELTAKHALAVDIAVPQGRIVSTYWGTEEGRITREFYNSHTVDFWNKASTLIKRAGPKLKTLCLISARLWDRPNRSYKGTPDASPKVLGALNNATFPNLVFLAVNHNAVSESAWFSGRDSSFQSPVLPSLRKLHVVSSVFLNGEKYEQVQCQRIHPVLATLITGTQEIQHLTICDCHLHMRSVEDILKGLFGKQWEGSMKNRILPGKLQTIVLQHGTEPYYGCGTGLMGYRRQAQGFVTSVRGLRIGGLEAHLPVPRHPKLGRREYEELLAEWKEECLIQV
ncbi:uncharacterized protein FOMMEDRAFT_170065 [Fomitiporia mediterranea MF3/22]|uniref:uncharacterized protein n=1 Tax=Fomitiporia mediterranea (strain MF3/22) TaxID=694068 RepID=UPI0004407650|nr:uncharacterized protein FOMMEDRAFT_170065 [Fomitiporia mediterranea MF3/22]EJC99975.1 hypothetical protein FOMMEDRAFT_170065 [Fomitiporia mediterranea MF3/22]